VFVRQVKDMLAVDHPLSEQGVQEAVNLRAAIHAAGTRGAKGKSHTPARLHRGVFIDSRLD
jgi:hypothetical protein